MDAFDRLLPGLEPGERVSLRAVVGGAENDVLGFVTALDAEGVTVVDRRGVEHAVPRAGVRSGKRVPVARGRNPLATPPGLLDALAARAGAPDATHWVARLSDLLAGRTPPASVPAWGEWTTAAGVPARFEGEWVTLAFASGTAPDAVRAACMEAAWWATRMGARSALAPTADPAVAAALADLGFARLGPQSAGAGGAG